MHEDIKALREEIALLRERIADLESKQTPVVTLNFDGPMRVGTPMQPLRMTGAIPDFAHRC